MKAVVNTGYGSPDKLEIRQVPEDGSIVGTRHIELVGSLGADQVVDYTAEDFTQIGETFDFVFDAVGKTTFFQCRRLLMPKGPRGGG